MELLPRDFAPADELDMAALYSGLSPEHRTILRRMAEALAKPKGEDQ